LAFPNAIPAWPAGTPRHPVGRPLRSVNSHIVAAQRGQAPATYRESFQAIAQLGIITPGLAADLAPSAGMRNILIHEYIEMDLGLVCDAIPAALAGYPTLRDRRRTLLTK
jgi:uncharacterized protein YutE (UPF0331/DUF86 family)